MIGKKILNGLVESHRIVEDLHASQLEKVGAPAFDLRLGEVHEFTSDGFLGVDERKTPETKILGKYNKDESSFVTLEPGKYYVVKTIETVNLPGGIACKFVPRTTLFRSGLLLLCGLGDPGYSGGITAGLINLTDKPFRIELGSRIANAVFYRVEGDTDLYKSAYHGGKIGTDKS